MMYLDAVNALRGTSLPQMYFHLARLFLKTAKKWTQSRAVLGAKKDSQILKKDASQLRLRTASAWGTWGIISVRTALVGSILPIRVLALPFLLKIVPLEMLITAELAKKAM